MSLREAHKREVLKNNNDFLHIALGMVKIVANDEKAQVQCSNRIFADNLIDTLCNNYPGIYRYLQIEYENMCFHIKDKCNICSVEMDDCYKYECSHFAGECKNTTCIPKIFVVLYRLPELTYEDD